MKNLEIQIELQALITEREGMIARNRQDRLEDGVEETFGWADFQLLVDKIRALIDQIPKLNCQPGAIIYTSDKPQTLQCSICNLAPEDKTKVAGDICRAQSSTGHGIDRCQGVLMKG